MYKHWTIQVILIFPLIPTLCSSVFEGLRHFQLRQRILVSSFSRLDILTNHKRRRACDLTCSTFTAAKANYQVLAASIMFDCFPVHDQGRMQQNLVVLWVKNSFSSINGNELLRLLLKNRFA